MYNITVRPVFVIIVFCLFLHGFLCGPAVLEAQEKKSPAYEFSVSSRLGILYGQAEEIVYPDNTKGEFLSQLLWDMKPVGYYGLSLDFAQARPLEKWGFSSSLSLKRGIPGKSGIMEDRDWMSTENDSLTHFSSHENYTKGIFMLDFYIGFSFPFINILLLKTGIGVSYTRFRFSGRGGYGMYAKNLGGGDYAPIDDDPNRWTVPDGETVINYTQEWFIAAPCLSLQYFILPFLAAELSLRISPLVLCSDLDEHLSADDQYRDYTRGGLFLAPGFRLSAAAGRWLNCSLGFTWTHIGGSRGAAYKSSPIGSGTYLPAGTAGTGLRLADTELVIGIRL